MIQKGCKYWCMHDNKPMECILIDVLEHCYEIQTKIGVGYTRKVFENREQVELYLKSLTTNVPLMSSLQRITEGRMDVIDILISLLCLDEKKIGNLRRCIVEIQKKGYANYDDIHFMSNCGIPLYKKYLRDNEFTRGLKYVAESFTMDFGLVRKYITEFVVELSEDVIKGLEFNKNTRL